jgi:hypothetical protein
VNIESQIHQTIAVKQKYIKHPLSLSHFLAKISLSSEIDFPNPSLKNNVRAFIQSHHNS